ncbi:unnamed protein product [Bursaphelenchus xylophilus]|nr:unnamed protein product [Bursaphelenchus xylophilus]CAG9117482.1 unnamed protein product [Bursaphelenchus xylophilus]
MAVLVNSYVWQLIVLALVCLACTFATAQPVGILGLETQGFNESPFEQIQLRERKSNNLRNLMRIGRRTPADQPIVPGFEMRQAPLDYAQFFRPNAAIF